MTDYQRRRSVRACDLCHLRKTKCDARKPRCGSCELNNAACVYRSAPEPRPSRLEVDISKIRERLDQMTTLLESVRHNEESQSVHHATPSPRPTIDASETSHVSLADRDGVNTDFPVMVIQCRSMMRFLDLDLELATWLVNMEHATAAYPALAVASLGSSTSRLFMMQSNRVTVDLASFSENVHIWYPLFSANFYDTFFHAISNVDNSPTQSCLAVLILATGCVAGSDRSAAALNQRPELMYIHEANSLLPHLFLEHSIPALQCLVLFAIYHLHLLQPCQAHDYILAASSRVQNMLRSRQYPPDTDSGDLLGRAYWTILLIESELLIQLDLPQSGIWSFNESVPLPSTSTVGHLPPHQVETVTAPLRSSSSPSSIPSNTPADHTLVYFLFEIAMRRILQRCNTSLNKSAGGRLRFSPVIATELELQLHEWYDHLPPLLRFPKTLDDRDHGALNPNAQFLQAQYFACKASIYWPAVYQSIESGEVTEKRSGHCTKFFNACILFVPAAASSFKTCRVNGWSLAASIFIITMAALRAAMTPSLDKRYNYDRLQNCFTHAVQVFMDIGTCRPSLTALGRILDERVAAIQNKSLVRDEHSMTSTRNMELANRDRK
ncbi:hypothetical protein FOQG_18053 [Fusarium oxysporum f. sp. raphani 54005]|uniref:Zn(2)-C6 fungal-type domain-containing protein n=3 Tax=Fusarium oxysporum TaxID=5507 RepID=X0B653_FUSOX|nr:hypothetical protein FOXB_00961 [Fusarium oxysporum f. sp. conglutinans Fo5176]EXK77231.1 hypothetical protein FOQG_18053 [Fusarium oxysporum f. sp. raphani 54005]